MVCISCIVIPLLLYVWHRFLQPIALKIWNPWQTPVEDKTADTSKDDETKSPSCPFNNSEKASKIDWLTQCELKLPVLPIKYVPEFAASFHQLRLLKELLRPFARHRISYSLRNPHAQGNLYEHNAVLHFHTQHEQCWLLFHEPFPQEPDRKLNKSCMIFYEIEMTWVIYRITVVVFLLLHSQND